jgi:pyrimidine operon attenuation protein/uracil phosphoribosyltransferase
MPRPKVILSQKRFELTIDRLCHSLIETYDDFDQTVIIGIQQRGALFANRIHQRLGTIKKNLNIDYGKLDITFFRDDFRTSSEPLQASSTEINFLIEDKHVILIDDVLYTGRTVHAAIAAMQQFGRPRSVDLMVLVDRRFNRTFPIKSNHVGITVDALNEDYVKVEWAEEEGEDRILFFTAQRKEIESNG